MKKTWAVFVMISVLTTAAVSLLIAQPEDILIDHGEAYGTKQRPAVAFPHEIHMAGDLSCTDCHHQYDDKGENVLDESELEEGNPEIRCAHCHTQKTRINLRQAFHRQCVGCHTKTHTDGKDTGPRLCGECHRRT